VVKKAAAVSANEDVVFTDTDCPDQDVFDQEPPEEVEELKDPGARRKLDATTSPVNLFSEAARQDRDLQAKREQDRQVALLIGAKNLERLRAFGFEVSKVAASLAPLTTDGRSLERDA
jgi:hypothetical protein